MEPDSAIPSCPMEEPQSKVVERIDSLKYSINTILSQKTTTRYNLSTPSIYSGKRKYITKQEATV